jgi:predicted Zn-dependent protease
VAVAVVERRSGAHRGQGDAHLDGAATTRRQLGWQSSTTTFLLTFAQVHLRTGDLAAAERRIDESILKHGRTGAAIDCQAWLLTERGDRERSLATLREAVRVDPNHPGALWWWLALAEEARTPTGQPSKRRHNGLGRSGRSS